jgi:hypothetical protein
VEGGGCTTYRALIAISRLRKPMRKSAYMREGDVPDDGERRETGSGWGRGRVLEGKGDVLKK